MTANRVRFDFDFVSDDLQGDHDLTPYAVLDAVQVWSNEVSFTMRPDTENFEVRVIDTAGPTGWPVVRVTGVLPHVIQFARAYAPDEDEATLLDWIFLA